MILRSSCPTRKSPCGQEPRIKTVYPFADQRTTAFVVEADSADELGRVINGLPGSRLSTFEAHPIGTVQAVLDVLSEWEQALPGQPGQ